jgi:hypothetical protein
MRGPETDSVLILGAVEPKNQRNGEGGTILEIAVAAYPKAP